ncbi:nucleotidyltransferase family protein [Saprospira grandis]|uniref:nucleotidyltransferase family protein n=1 Tax=Saprospira grandis TaxID=1008 RepID=UPI0022DD09A2|nr:nucleotidyltransferase family protein [Saprospira grandis]WBM74697.1 nucleotidyltransferase family protein [Saprospira grandis]
MQAMIFAAGLGSRLAPLTNHIPKALVPLGKQPIIQYWIDRLQQAECQQLIVNVHSHAQQLIEYLQALELPFPLLISDERGQLLETGGGLRQAAPLLLPDQPLFLLNADIYCNFDFGAALDFWAQKGQPLGVLAMRQRPSSRQLLFLEEELVGWQNKKTGEYRWARAADPLAVSAYAFSGISLLGPAAFSLLAGPKAKFSIIDFFLNWAKSDRLLAYLHQQEDWFDIGTPARLAQAEAYLLDQ